MSIILTKTYIMFEINPVFRGRKRSIYYFHLLEYFEFGTNPAFRGRKLSSVNSTCSVLSLV